MGKNTDMNNKKGILAGYSKELDIISQEFNNLSKRGNFEAAFEYFCKNVDIIIDNSRFVYFIDYKYQFDTSINNITPDYKKILNCGLWNRQYSDEQDNCEFTNRYNSVLNSLVILVERIISVLEKAESDDHNCKIKWFRAMLNKPSEGLEESVQRILFLNQLLWQTGSELVGLGRLDQILIDYYVGDISKGIVTREYAFRIIEDMLDILHKDYWYKSSALMGDTGQVINLGGLNSDGQYLGNELTALFLEVIMKSCRSDPKAVLRVSKGMNKEYMHYAVECMKTGNGSPLLANDDVIIPRLLEFGIEREDAYNYATSACWEPLIAGKSSSMNNQGGFSYLKVLNCVFAEERLDRLESIDDIIEIYLYRLKIEVYKALERLDRQRYKRNTLYSMFIDGCKDSKKDIIDGGAVYHNIGMTTVGLGNTVNALLNVSKYVFEEKKYSLADVKRMVLCNYDDNAALAKELKGNDLRYGVDNDIVIGLTNRLIRFVTRCTDKYRTRCGGRVKFGVSSPSYIMDDSRKVASFDGRLAGEPLTVHISNEKANSYTEVINFAGALDYAENRFNGNVVDLIVNPVFINKHQEKFESLLMSGIEAGFFELQTNIIDSSVLIEAKSNPDKYEHLIVRVWGFSAYFVELPEEYQDLLISRTIENEGRSA